MTTSQKEWMLGHGKPIGNRVKWILKDPETEEIVDTRWGPDDGYAFVENERIQLDGRTAPTHIPGPLASKTREGIDEDGNWFHEVEVPLASLVPLHTRQHFAAMAAFYVVNRQSKSETSEEFWKRACRVNPQIRSFMEGSYREDYTFKRFLEDHGDGL